MLEEFVTSPRNVDEFGVNALNIALKISFEPMSSNTKNLKRNIHSLDGNGWVKSRYSSKRRKNQSYRSIDIDEKFAPTSEWKSLPSCFSERKEPIDLAWLMDKCVESAALCFETPSTPCPSPCEHHCQEWSSIMNDYEDLDSCLLGSLSLACHRVGINNGSDVQDPRGSPTTTDAAAAAAADAAVAADVAAGGGLRRRAGGAAGRRGARSAYNQHIGHLLCSEAADSDAAAAAAAATAGPCPL